MTLKSRVWSRSVSKPSSQAETDAATADAQAVAWGDIEGEKSANADALKAAKTLATATEQNRRQQLIINALEQELATVDKYIAEAQQERLAIEKKALRLARTVLEKKVESGGRDFA